MRSGFVIPDVKYKAKPDNTFMNSSNLKDELLSGGEWIEKEIIRNTHSGKIDTKFRSFYRKRSALEFPKIEFRENWKNMSGSADRLQQGTEDANSIVDFSGMGVASGEKSTTKNVGVEKGEKCYKYFSDIESVRDMRLEENSFVVSCDTEFYYEGGQRYILSYQFAFTPPDDPLNVYEMIVFASGKNTLTVEEILAFIIEEWNIPRYFGWTDNDGVAMRGLKYWSVPVATSKNGVKYKKYKNFDKAVKACCDSAVSEALSKCGENYRMKMEYIGSDEKYRPVEKPKTVVNGCGIGFQIDYQAAEKLCIPVTLVCHAGKADLPSFRTGYSTDFDLMRILQEVNGGLVTLRDRVVHTQQPSKYWNDYPIRLSVRDTMCFAPAKKKKLEDLGKCLKVPKLELPGGYSKDDMLSFMKGDIKAFCDYATNDSLITLLYSCNIWDFNKAMPVTLIAGAVRVGKRVIKQHFGINPDDKNSDDEYNRLYRGDVKDDTRGKIYDSDGQNYRYVHEYNNGVKSGSYLKNTYLIPCSPEAKTIQDFAEQAYLGGFNSCLYVGFFKKMTYDYDLKNAYPTSMALVPDLDWENPIDEVWHDVDVTFDHVRSPLDLVVGCGWFEFPKGVYNTSIPIKRDNNLIYVRTNNDDRGVYFSAPELWLALKLGAKVHASTLYRCNHKRVKSSPRSKKTEISYCLRQVVQRFVRDRDIAKKHFGEGSVQELVMKTCVNGLYGKTAQNVIDKTAWSPLAQSMASVGGSAVSSPMHACLTTSAVRAVLIATVNQVVALGYHVYSVTTDGFISDIPFDELKSLDLYGLADVFKESRKILTGSEELWSLKHRQNDLCNFTTRGNVSLNVGDSDGYAGVMAHAGLVTGFTPDSYEDRFKTMEEVMTRDGRVESLTKEFVGVRALTDLENREDFSVGDRTSKLRLDFDMKRKPLEDTIITNGFYFEDDEGVDDVWFMACFNTECFENPQEFDKYRKMKENFEVLRTAEELREYLARVNYNNDGVRRHIKTLEHTIIKSAITAYRQKIPLKHFNNKPAVIPYLDSKDHTVEEKVEWINSFYKGGKKFTLNMWKDCTRPKSSKTILNEEDFIDMFVKMQKALQ